jgi:hypothetical protein
MNHHDRTSIPHAVPCICIMYLVHLSPSLIASFSKAALVVIARRMVEGKAGETVRHDARRTPDTGRRRYLCKDRVHAACVLHCIKMRCRTGVCCHVLHAVLQYMAIVSSRPFLSARVIGRVETLEWLLSLQRSIARLRMCSWMKKFEKVLDWLCYSVAFEEFHMRYIGIYPQIHSSL